ncbi:hypothetical protein PLICRDRAFT_93777 [Plicaturopsis crispa FD-325 SS-3]|nr:hypothetical protein PLICRDRAFT_93777 [Plicaturopsis crispa FD-325 SS-3]
MFNVLYDTGSFCCFPQIRWNRRIHGLSIYRRRAHFTSPFFSFIYRAVAVRPMGDPAYEPRGYTKQPCQLVDDLDANAVTHRYIANATYLLSSHKAYNIRHSTHSVSLCASYRIAWPPKHVTPCVWMGNTHARRIVVPIQRSPASSFACRFVRGLAAGEHMCNDDSHGMPNIIR